MMIPVKDPIPPEHLEVIETIRSEIIDKFPVPTFQDTTDKVFKLVDLLKSCNNVESFSAIIFVERRTHTQVLADILSSIKELSFISATPLVGHNKEMGTGMKTKHVSITRIINFVICVGSFRTVILIATRCDCWLSVW